MTGYALHTPWHKKRIIADGGDDFDLSAGAFRQQRGDPSYRCRPGPALFIPLTAITPVAGHDQGAEPIIP